MILKRANDISPNTVDLSEPLFLSELDNVDVKSSAYWAPRFDDGRGGWNVFSDCIERRSKRMSNGIEMAKDFRIIDLLCRIESKDDQDSDVPRVYSFVSYRIPSI